MKIRFNKEDYGTLTLEIGDNFFIEFVNRWAWLLHPCNWFDVELIAITFEKDSMLDGYEFIFVILGFGFRARLNIYDESNEVIKRIKASEERARENEKRRVSKTKRP